MKLSEEFRQSQCKWVNETPAALSLLYDLDLLPEQATSPEHEHFIHGAIFILKMKRSSPLAEFPNFDNE